MHRTMTGFHQDETGDWVAELGCLHTQHIRHEPPFRDAPWINDDHSRGQRVGQALDCPLCDRTELPDGLREARTTAVWTDTTLPSALLRSHHLAAGTWGLLRVDWGRLGFHADTSPPLHTVVECGSTQAIPPEVGHHIEIIDEVGFAITFLRP